MPPFGFPSVPGSGKEKGVFDVLNDAFDKALKNLSVARKKTGDNVATTLLEANEIREKTEEIFHANHESGKYRLTDEAKKVVVDQAKNYLFAGSVDREQFRKATKREDIIVYKETGADGKEQGVNWYKDMSRAAMGFLNLQGNVEVNFPSLRDAAKKTKAMEIVKTFSEMKDFTDAAWAKMIKDKGYSDDEVFGSEGAYQLLLAFQRSMAAISDQSNFPANEKYKIRLEIADVEGKSEKHRYTKVLTGKLKEKKPEVKPPVAPPVKPPVAPPVKPPVAPPPVPPVKPLVAPPVKPPVVPPVAPPPAPPKAPEATKESPEALKIKEMLANLRTLGFEIVIAPSKFGVDGYAKYDADPKTPKRIGFSLNADGTYNYKMVTLPDGRPDLSGKSVDGMTIKGALDGMKFSDPVKVLKEDFLHVPGYQVSIKALTGKSPQGDEYEPNTYAVTVKNQKYENKKTGVISAAFDAEFEVELNQVVGYKGYDKEGNPLPPFKDAKKFIAEAVKNYYDRYVSTKR